MLYRRQQEFDSNPAPSRFIGVVDGGDGAQQIGHDLDRSDLLGARSTAGFAGAVDHDIDLRKQVRLPKWHLFEVGNQRLLRTICLSPSARSSLYPLMALSGVRKSWRRRLWTNPKSSCSRRMLSGSLIKRSMRRASSALAILHAVEIGNRVVETEALGIHGDDV